MARQLRRVLDAILDGVIVLDGEGRVEQLNAEASRILGTSQEAAFGHPVEQLPGGPVLGRLGRDSLASGHSSTEHEVRLERRGAPTLVAEVASSPLLDERGGIDGAVVLLRDRTIGDALRELWSGRERMEDFARIAAGIAHEVKNPLGGIRGAAELVASRSGDERNRQAAELIVREVDRIATLVDDLGLLTRGGELRLAPVNLHRLLDDVLDLIAMDPLGAGAKVERRYDPSLPDLLADADRLTQVFLNLIRNGLEALEAGGGSVRITTRVRLDHRVDPGRTGSVPSLAIEVEDTGHGMPPDLLARATTPFVTTRPRGSGLGLAVAQHFVALHGGVLQLASEPGRGTRARVLLPLRRTP